MHCNICLNEDEKYFYYYQGHYYCRKCIGLKKKQATKIIHQNKSVDYRLDYKLTSSQLSISKQLVKRYQNGQNTILKAVCGAGKTEMIYDVLKYALNKNHQVCYTTPRKELVIEIAHRIQKDFTNIQPVLVYGGHTSVIEGPLIICTCHQLYRYRQYFDLLILDEYDAFPYYHNTTLENILKTSIKGHYIFMSATLEKGHLQLLSRYHHHPIPEPKCFIGNDFMNLIRMLFKIQGYRKKGKPVLIFVPSISSTKTLSRYLSMFRIKNAIASSKVKNIHELLTKLKSHELDVIVTTTILERGMTIADIQIMIYKGEHHVFNRETLIQIAGRAGRKVPYVDGDVLIYACRKTKAISSCIKQIQNDNALSARKT